MLIKLAEGVSFGTSPSVISQAEIPIDYRDHAQRATALEDVNSEGIADVAAAMSASVIVRAGSFRLALG